MKHKKKTKFLHVNSVQYTKRGNPVIFVVFLTSDVVKFPWNERCFWCWAKNFRLTFRIIRVRLYCSTYWTVWLSDASRLRWSKPLAIPFHGHLRADFLIVVVLLETLSICLRDTIASHRNTNTLIYDCHSPTDQRVSYSVPMSQWYRPHRHWPNENHTTAEGLRFLCAMATNESQRLNQMCFQC